MKYIYKLTLATLFMFTIFACSDLMDKSPLDKFSEDSVWEDLNLTEAYVNNQYKVLPKLGWYEWIRAYQLSAFTDEAVHKYGYHGVNDYWKGIMNPSNITSIDVWKYHYDYINGCNIFLENIEDVPADSDEEIEMKNHLTGQIYALRAWSYLDLAARYNGVVLITESFNLDDDFTRSRSTFEETVALVISDLDKAVDLLPEEYVSDGEWGRLTKGAALAMKSRILLYAASPLFNPSGDKTKWEAAAKAAKAVIELQVYHLEQDYKQIFLTNVNTEIIMSRGNDAINADGYYQYFQIVEGLGGGTDGNGYAGGWSTTNVSQNLVDAFEMNDGTAFDWNNPVHQANPYKNRDPRLYASVTVDGSPWIGSTAQFWVTEESNNYTLNPLDPNFKISNTVYGNNSIGNPIKRNDVPDMSYLYRKSMDPDYDIAAEQYPFSVPWIIFRYAEIYLNYAEASFEAGDEGTALTYLNMVRDRVSMPAVTASGNELRKKIHHERRIELCLEAHRYFDARRWKIAEQAFSETIKGVRIVKDKNSDTKVYNVYDSQTRTFPEKYYFQPIPQYELNRVQLEQNPGY